MENKKKTEYQFTYQMEGAGRGVCVDFRLSVETLERCCCRLYPQQMQYNKCPRLMIILINHFVDEHKLLL